MTWFVYIAQSRFRNYYTGISPDPQKRIDKHNIGDGSQFARDQGPVRLVYVSKPFPNKSEARKREIQIKGWAKVKKQKLISGEWK